MSLPICVLYVELLQVVLRLPVVHPQGLPLLLLLPGLRRRRPLGAAGREGRRPRPTEKLPSFHRLMMIFL